MCAARAFTFAAMPPKQMKDASVFSLVTSWMQPKPKTEEQHHPEHEKTGDQTPSPTEVAESSQKTMSPTDVVESQGVDPETVGTDEGPVITELMAQAAVQNVTMQVLVTKKRPRTEPESTEPAAPEEAD